MKNILIGGAWPYANGSLHIGHIAALLPGDVLARYFRAKNENVIYVSGSDCHGTPITVRAKQESREPEEISEHYHHEFCQVFERLGFSYDLYSKTSDEKHIEFVREFHREMYKGEYIAEREVKQAYCPKCSKILSDRLIKGKCPICGEETRGDQCDNCGEILEPEAIVEPKCTECESALVFKNGKELFLLVTKLRNKLELLLESNPYWRKNAASFTKRYIDEGLRDRAITRELDWGIPVPKERYEKKKIYIWAENVLGYFSAAHQVCESRGCSFEEFIGENSRHYYVHGKDNIPFHTIILPSLLLAHGKNFHLPDDIISSEYMTLEGKKISTSRNWAVWAKELAENYDPDSVRYFFITNGPEKRDADFTWQEFFEHNNSELVGTWGNFVNRTLAFAVKYLDGDIPANEPENEMRERVEQVFLEAGQLIENGCFKDALKIIFDLIRFGNKYYDTNEPWKTRKNDIENCKKTISDCVYMILNIAVLLHPFIPFSSGKVLRWLGGNSKWEPQNVGVNMVPDDYNILFSRIGK